MTEKPHRFRSIGSKRSFEPIIREMQKAITRGDLKPGQKLPAEPELAAQFGVSRSALREALKALELSGYLEVRRGYGGGTFVSAPEFEEFTVIAPPSVSSLEVTRRHLLEVRLAVEPQAARLAVTAPFEEILSLHEAIRHMESFDDRPAHVLAAAANFHISLSRASGNPVFVSVLEGLRPVMFRAMASLVKDSEWRETCRLQHETIVKEIEKGDADGAENAMRVHLSAKEGEGA